MSITVITPVYNAAPFLADTLRSVTDQSWTDFEHLIVDDGSRDDSVAIARAHAAEDARARVIVQPNAGVSAARNNGLAQVRDRSDFVLFLDHDDLLRPDAQRVLVDALGAAPDAPGAHGAAAGIDGDGRSVPLVRGEASARRTVPRPERLRSSRADVVALADDARTGLESLAYVCHIYTVGQVLLRRRALPDVRPFDPFLRSAQDYDLWLRLVSRVPFASVPDVVLDYRQTDVSLSTDQGTIRREDLYSRFRAITDHDTPRHTRDMIRHLHRHHEWHRAADRIDLLRAAIRRRDAASAGREVVRSARSTAEAVLAVPAWERPFAYRVARHRRRAGGA